MEKTNCQYACWTQADHVMNLLEWIERWHRQDSLSCRKNHTVRHSGSSCLHKTSAQPHGNSFTWCIHKVQVRYWSSVSWWPAGPQCNHTGSTAHCEFCTQNDGTLQHIVNSEDWDLEMAKQETGSLGQLGHDEAVGANVTHEVQDWRNTVQCPVRSTQLL